MLIKLCIYNILKNLIKLKVLSLMFELCMEKHSVKLLIIAEVFIKFVVVLLTIKPQTNVNNVNFVGAYARFSVSVMKAENPS
jgi:hypothetical protein